MNEPAVNILQDNLPFYITGPGETDVLLIAVAIALVAIVVGFGALYFTIQAIPDRIAKGSSKAQMQLVGLLGLISLFTMNNLYWIAAILLAAIRIPDLLTPLTEIGQALKAGALRGGAQPAERAVTEGSGSDPQHGEPGAATDA